MLSFTVTETPISGVAVTVWGVAVVMLAVLSLYNEARIFALKTVCQTSSSWFRFLAVLT